MTLTLGAALCVGAGCNEHTVETVGYDGALGVDARVGRVGERRVDLLWVLDSSGSMCQEQRFLRENFSRFIDTLDPALDLHLGVTTMHAPDPGEPDLAIVSRAGHLQSEPQPVPGADLECVGDAGSAEDPSDGYAPLRASLAAALDCLEAPAAPGAYAWTDAQIACALDARKCAPDTPTDDRNGDGRFDRFDLFPARTLYRALPKVLRSRDFVDAQTGALDRQAMGRAFSCMSLVGTRGSGVEKGLRAATLAVSPTLTQGADAPNRGFLRADATFGVIFVTDENDCSHDGSLDLATTCGADACDYLNSPALADSSPLLSVAQLKAQLMDNLSASRGAPVGDEDVFAASIHGFWKRSEVNAVPACTSGASDPALISCTTALGSARSGDRYERFIRQFSTYFPNDLTAAAPDDLTTHEIGWMCLGDFSPALTGIASLANDARLPCVDASAQPCDTAADCPAHRFTPERAPACLTTATTPSFCDSGVALVLAERATSANTLATSELCAPGSLAAFGVGTCALHPSLYTWTTCARGAGATPQLDPRLRTSPGYDLRIVYGRGARVAEEMRTQ